MSECKTCQEACFDAEQNTAVPSCPAVGYQKVGVCVPVAVAPYAHVGTISARCCGIPVVKSGAASCPGEPDGVCCFTISQNICVEVPVEFGANVTIGDTYVNCQGASLENCCNECHKKDY